MQQFVHKQGDKLKFVTLFIMFKLFQQKATLQFINILKIYFKSVSSYIFNKFKIVIRPIVVKNYILTLHKFTFIISLRFVSISFKGKRDF